VEDTLTKDVDDMSKVRTEICHWCGVTFNKSFISRSLYCTQECRTNKQRSTERNRMQTDYKYIVQQEPRQTYQYYLDNPAPESEHIVPPIVDVPSVPGGKRIKVPDIKFKMYRENENILQWSWRREKQRSYWE
jgi:hypothetical protein